MTYSWNPIQLLWDLTAAVGRIEAKMAALDDDEQALVAEVQRNTGLVTGILNQLKNGASQAQLDLITQATSALKASDDAMAALNNPTPTPGPGPVPAGGGAQVTGARPGQPAQVHKP